MEDAIALPASQVSSLDKIVISEKLAQFTAHWQPKIIGDLNGQHVKLAKFQGAFDWHHHELEDELFLVLRGSFRMELRDRVIELTEGDMLVVPRGVEHRPVADTECAVMLFEPAGTLNTGTVRTARTLDRLERI